MGYFLWEVALFVYSNFIKNYKTFFFLVQSLQNPKLIIKFAVKYVVRSM